MSRQGTPAWQAALPDHIHSITCKSPAVIAVAVVGQLLQRC